MSKIDLKKMSGMTRFAIHFLMSLIFIFLFSFCAWLIYLTYFKASYEVSGMANGSKTELQEIAYGKKKIYEHFHNIDDAVMMGAESTSICLKCHGNYPHSKAPDIRSFLNAHAYFLACETCHYKYGKSNNIVHKWLSSETGKEITSLKGEAGNYGGKVVPVRYVGGVMERLDESSDKEFVENYLESQGSLNADQQAEAKMRIHEDISEKPVFCDDCHRENGLLDFQKLHYSLNVANRLERGEVAGMVNKYKKFYLPTMFDPAMKYIDRKK